MRIHIVTVCILLAVTTADASKLDFKSFFGKLGSILDTIGTLIKGSNKRVPENGKPGFCGTYECPPFKTLNKTKVYDVRCYDAVNWVSTEGYGDPTPMRSASRKMFMKLFNYIRGANKQKTEIAMTVPVLTNVKGEGASKNLKMSFYVPSKFQKNVPAPTTSAVRIENMKFCAYVRSFKSTIFFSNYARELQLLKKQLSADGLQGTYDASFYVTAGYDGPSKFFNRYNEVMLIKV